MPHVIKQSLVVDYLFKDLYIRYSRFFTKEILFHKEMLYDFAFGFQPRIFEPDDTINDDGTIYDE